MEQKNMPGKIMNPDSKIVGELAAAGPTAADAAGADGSLAADGRQTLCAEYGGNLSGYVAALVYPDATTTTECIGDTE